MPINSGLLADLPTAASEGAAAVLRRSSMEAFKVLANLQRIVKKKTTFTFLFVSLDSVWACWLRPHECRGALTTHRDEGCGPSWITPSASL